MARRGKRGVKIGKTADAICKAKGEREEWREMALFKWMAVVVVHR